MTVFKWIVSNIGVRRCCKPVRRQTKNRIQYVIIQKLSTEIAKVIEG